MRVIHRHKLIKRERGWHNLAAALPPVSPDGMEYGTYSTGGSVGYASDDLGIIAPKIVKTYLLPSDGTPVPLEPVVTYTPPPVYTPSAVVTPPPVYTPSVVAAESFDPYKALAAMSPEDWAALQNIVINPVVIDIPTVQAKVDIAKEVIPELFVPTNTTLQNDLILSQAKEEAISIIKEAQPEVSTTYLESITNVVELVQMAAVIEQSPEIPAKIVQEVVQEQTNLSIKESTQTGVYIAPVEPEVYKPVSNTTVLNTAPVDNTSPAIIQKTNEIIKTMGTQLGLTDKQIATPDTIEKDKNTLYIAGIVAVIGLLALMFKK